MRFSLASTVLALTFCAVASAQLISFERINGKEVTCMHSGLSSALSDCGTRSDWYAYVFVGSILSVTPAKDDESQIQIVPEEVFAGKPESPMTVLTSQGVCLPKFRIGDRWLFYLRKEKDKPIVLDYYGNDSVPVAKAETQIATFRRLQKLGDFGILRGEVVKGSFPVSSGLIPNATVNAVRKSDSRRFVTSTGIDGRYEFQPLPPGAYDVTVGPVRSYQPDGSGVEIEGGACWALTLDRSPHARISGYVRHFNGSPVSHLDLVLLESDNSGYVTAQTDEKGLYSFDQLSPGEFVIGLNYPPRPDWFNGAGSGSDVPPPPASTFYPGVPERANAQIIKLSTDQKLQNIDFHIPN